MLWTRAELKSRAKDVLKRGYWGPFLVSLILAIVAGGGGGSASSFNFNLDAPTQEDFLASIATGVSGIDRRIINFLIPLGFLMFIVIIAVFIIRILIGYNLEIGANRYFMGKAQDLDVGSNTVVSTFAKETFGNVFAVMFIRSIRVFLWSLLLIVPGIVKGYAYSMVPYIIADNPNIDASRAMEISERMVWGEKFKIFVLGLSFILWDILGVVTFGIGFYFIAPYKNMTTTELYLRLRENAIANNITTAEELLLV